MTAAIRDPDPVLYLEHKFLYRRLKEEIAEGELVVPIGKAKIARAGKDVSIITYAAMLQVALEAAAAAEADGISVEVVDLRTLLPLDVDAILATAGKTGKVIVLHEATLTGGPAARSPPLIAERAFEYLDAPVRADGPPRHAGALLPAAGRVFPAKRGQKSARRYARSMITERPFVPTRGVPMTDVIMPQMGESSPMAPSPSG
jgi:2-oxoisovalerate dehydrogenase E1 component beta subunit